MLNTAILMGRLTADPELKYTPNNVAVTSFTIAVDRSYVKSGEERQTDFIDIVAWRGAAEFICKYFRKGQMIAVQGAIQTRSYTDKEGVKRKAFEIVAEQVSFCGSKQEQDGRQPQADTSAQTAPDIQPAYDDPRMTPDDDLPF